MDASLLADTIANNHREIFERLEAIERQCCRHCNQGQMESVNERRGRAGRGARHVVSSAAKKLVRELTSSKNIPPALSLSDRL